MKRTWADLLKEQLQQTRRRNSRNSPPGDHQQSKRKFVVKKVRRSFGFAIFGFVIFGVLLFTFYYNIIINRFESITNLQNENTTLYDIEGKPFHVIQGVESRRYAELDEITINISKAVLAIEDARFFKHYGFDPIRLVKAFITVLSPSLSIQGASTITQQLAKLTLFSSERTYTRKIKEFFASIALEIKYPKEKILALYLNKIYLGKRNYGVYNASLNYFDKLPSQLTLGESALLAGLIKKPEGYSPFKDVKKTRERQVIALQRMQELGWITEKEYKKAMATPVEIKGKNAADLNRAPHFTNHVILKLLDKYGYDKVYGGGLRVFTTLNLEKQRKLEMVIEEEMSKAKSFSEIAAVSIEPSTGFVTALVGGADFNSSEFNRATQAQRQPGSSFKPFLYTTAMMEGLKSEDIFIDEPTFYPNEFFVEGEPDYYEPRNFNEAYLGEITLAQALQDSNNVVSVKILDLVKIKTFAKVASKFGFKLPEDRGLCLALGCGEVTLIDLVSGYSVFANNGIRHEPRSILKVIDNDGKTVEDNQANKGVKIIPEEINTEMAALLKNVIFYGTGRNARTDSILGGKTGTNDDFRDAWFVGYTSNSVTGFWIGNDDNEPMEREVGGGTPALLWKKFYSSL